MLSESGNKSLAVVILVMAVVLSAVAATPDDDVLLLRPGIVDLDVTSPAVDSPARSYNFAASGGAATLYLEVFDSVSGEILARTRPPGGPPARRIHAVDRQGHQPSGRGAGSR